MGSRRRNREMPQSRTGGAGCRTQPQEDTAAGEDGLGGGRQLGAGQRRGKGFLDHGSDVSRAAGR